MHSSRPNGRKPISLRRAALIVVMVAAGVFSLTRFSSAIDLGQIQRIAAKGARGMTPTTITAWIKLLADVRDLPEGDRLKPVNDFFNRNIRFEDDATLWGRQDYWATPLETLTAGAGDCEDFGIAKYFSLHIVGIPNARLRLIYVKAQLGGPSSGISQAHMVLAYYAAPDSEPLVLDNHISEIRPASRRPDLSPVFSFNSEGIWAGAGANQAAGDTSRLSRWRDLLVRARNEGFD